MQEVSTAWRAEKVPDHVLESSTQKRADQTKLVQVPLQGSQSALHCSLPALIHVKLDAEAVAFIPWFDLSLLFNCIRRLQRRLRATRRAWCNRDTGLASGKFSYCPLLPYTLNPKP